MIRRSSSRPRSRSSEELEAVADQVAAASRGDVRAAVKALIVANDLWRRK
jgi:hypothetical protein